MPRKSVILRSCVGSLTAGIRRRSLPGSVSPRADARLDVSSDPLCVLRRLRPEQWGRGRDVLSVDVGGEFSQDRLELKDREPRMFGQDLATTPVMCGDA